jgi:hypothetical protein
VIACGNGNSATPDAKAEIDAAEIDAGPETLEIESGLATVQRWQVYPLGAGKLRALAAVPGKVGQYLAVGDTAQAWRFDATQAHDISPQTLGKAHLRALWAQSESLAIAGGDGSTLALFDGKDWDPVGAVPPQPIANFTGVHGSGAKDAWAVTKEGAAWHFDGAQWEPRAVTPTGGELAAGAEFTCVAVAAENDIWVGAGPAVGGGGLVLHGDGKGVWTALKTDAVPAALYVVPGGKQRAFAVGGVTEDYVAISTGGGPFERQKAANLAWKQRFLALAGAGGDVWAAASKGQLRNWHEGTWTTVDIKEPIGSPKIFVGDDLVGVAVHNANELAVVTAGQIARWGQQVP